jgi:Lon protease-like protein
VAEQLPIFPLNTVLFPGVTLPLHIFEHRYRAMVRHLEAIPDRSLRLFGVVAIREGYEVGHHEARSLYRVGCVAQLTSVRPLDDGRFDVEAVGRCRMRVTGTDGSGPFVVAEVESFPEEPKPSPTEAHAAAKALAAFESYRTLLAELRGEEVLTGALPRDPELLSYSLAASCLLTLPERQQLLEASTTAHRLGLLARSLRQETAAMRALPSLPATEVARSRWCPN